MTWFISCRSDEVGGPVVEPRVFRQATPEHTNLQMEQSALFRRDIENRDVLIATHGFNVSRSEGVRSLARLKAHLAPREHECFVGLLWPGDYFVPVISYPAEAGDAVATGRHLASFCDRELLTARSVSFVSHSLGGRVLLETIQCMTRKVHCLCLTAAAVDWDCFEQQYAEVPAKVDRLVTLSSKKDQVLRLAYPAGDFFSDIFFDDNDSPYQRALGRSGPKPVPPANTRPHQISSHQNYGHSDYLPPSGKKAPTDTQRWERVAGFMAEIFRNQTASWPS